MTNKNQDKLLDYDYMCTKCHTRHPKETKKCFVCGNDKLEYNKIKDKRKKTNLKGAKLTINIGS